jgi:hypothetical protein
MFSPPSLTPHHHIITSPHHTTQILTQTQRNKRNKRNAKKATQKRNANEAQKEKKRMKNHTLI